MSVLLEDLQEVREGYGVADVARLLGVTHQTALNLIYRGELKAWKIGGIWRVTQADFHAFVEECRPQAEETDATAA